jgi:hypothetical protein
MPADNEKNAVVTVADIQGRIHFQDVFEVRDGMMRIRLNHLDSGIYFLSVSTEDFDNRQKILITR